MQNKMMFQMDNYFEETFNEFLTPTSLCGKKVPEGLGIYNLLLWFDLWFFCDFFHNMKNENTLAPLSPQNFIFSL